MNAPKTPNNLPRRHSDQIRIRLHLEERYTLEQARLDALRQGNFHAKTLSSWVRYQIHPYTHSVGHAEKYLLSQSLYSRIAHYAAAIGLTPDEFVEACIAEICFMVDHVPLKRTSLVKECRRRRAGNRTA